jgi:hypothetical protein
VGLHILTSILKMRCSVCLLMTSTGADFYEPIMECAYYFYKHQHQRGTDSVPATFSDHAGACSSVTSADTKCSTASQRRMNNICTGNQSVVLSRDIHHSAATETVTTQTSQNKSTRYRQGLKEKSTAVPLQAWSGPEGSRKLRFPDYMTTAQDGGKVVSLTHRPPSPPGNAPGTHFC